MWLYTGWSLLSIGVWDLLIIWGGGGAHTFPAHFSQITNPFLNPCQPYEPRSTGVVDFFSSPQAPNFPPPPIYSCIGVGVKGILQINTPSTIYWQPPQKEVFPESMPQILTKVCWNSAWTFPHLIHLCCLETSAVVFRLFPKPVNLPQKNGRLSVNHLQTIISH